MRTALLSLSVLMLSLFSARAYPPPQKVFRQRAVIEEVHKPDPTFETNIRAKGWLLVVGLDKKGKRTSVKYELFFSDSSKISVLSRSRGRQVVPLEDLRAGQELIFSGYGAGGAITPSIYTVYIP